MEAILWWVAKILAAEKDARLLDKAAERPDVVSTSHAAELPDAVVWQAAELQGIVASQAAEILDAVVGQPAEIPDLAAYQDCGSPDSVAWQVAELPGYLAWPYRGPIFSKTCAICTGTFSKANKCPKPKHLEDKINWARIHTAMLIKVTFLTTKKKYKLYFHNITECTLLAAFTDI